MIFFRFAFISTDRYFSNHKIAFLMCRFLSLSRLWYGAIFLNVFSLWQVFHFTPKKKYRRYRKNKKSPLQPPALQQTTCISQMLLWIWLIIVEYLWLAFAGNLSRIQKLKFHIISSIFDICLHEATIWYTIYRQFQFVCGK